MRLLKTLLITVIALAVTGSAFAAKTRDEAVRTMAGTARVASGGKLTVIVTHQSGSTRFRVVIRYDVNVKSKTRLGFAAYPCRNNRCGAQSVAKTGSLSARVHHVTFTGHVPVNKLGSSNKACVFVQVRDHGPKGKDPGKLIRKRNGGKGVVICRNV
ncbi:MAG: hypothetical protein QOH76_468 [Thermoleophilaceae bacterium]|jgi:hypothetical protein|nr:hypothetical protein [Thermoleophilaceae bacterium]